MEKKKNIFYGAGKPVPLLREKSKCWGLSTRAWKHSRAKLPTQRWQHLQVWKAGFQVLKCPYRLQTPECATALVHRGSPGCTDHEDVVWLQDWPTQRGKVWAPHTNPHPSAYATPATPNLYFSISWQQIFSPIYTPPLRTIQWEHYFWPERALTENVQFALINRA